MTVHNDLQTKITMANVQCGSKKWGVGGSTLLPLTMVMVLLIRGGWEKEIAHCYGSNNLYDP